jgi:hypothetical protein
VAVAADPDVGGEAGEAGVSVELGKGGTHGVLQPEGPAEDSHGCQQDEDEKEPAEEAEPGMASCFARH